MGSVVAIGGLDTSGGAGLAADRSAAAACKVELTTIETAVVEQDGRRGLLGVASSAKERIAAETDAALAAAPAAAIKLGMLPDAGVIKLLAVRLAAHKGPVVIDPVLGPSAGGSWADSAWLSAWREHLAPLATVVTPNMSEARRLIDKPKAHFAAAAGALRRMGCGAVVITGGDADGKQLCVDRLEIDGCKELTGWLVGGRLEQSARGTGCCHATSLACGLAKGQTLASAVVFARLMTAKRLSGNCAGLLPCFAKVRSRVSLGSGGKFNRPLGVCAIVDTPERIKPLAAAGVEMIQLRMEKDADAATVRKALVKSLAQTSGTNVRLIINDHWRLALEFVGKGIAGVHLGQKDLLELRGEDLAALRKSPLGLGLSAHNFFEAALALGKRPDYLSFGPVYPTRSKKLDYPPLGAQTLSLLCTAAPLPTMAIGGIDAEKIGAIAACGADGVAVIAAAANPKSAKKLLAAWDASVAQM